MTLEQKLKQVDANLADTRDSAERFMPYKTLEERMMKCKRELEAKYQNDLESEIRRLREYESSRIRIDEA